MLGSVLVQIPPATYCFYLFFCILNTLLTCYFIQDFWLVAPSTVVAFPGHQFLCTAPFISSNAERHMVHEVCTYPYVVLEPATQVWLNFIGQATTSLPHSMPMLPADKVLLKEE